MMEATNNPSLGTRQYSNVGNLSAPESGYKPPRMVEPDKAKVAEAIGRARRARGWSQERLAEEAGTSQSTVDRIEAGRWKRMPSDLFKVCRVLDLNFEAFVGVSDQVKTPLTSQPNSIVGERNLPVFASAEAGAGTMVLSTDAVDYVRRPAPLANVRDGYAMIVVGDSMVPAFEPGDMLLVHPHLPPVADSDVVLYADDGAGTVLVTVKRLRKVTADTWHLRQWNPPAGKKTDFTLPRKEWQKCHRIVGKYSRR